LIDKKEAAILALLALLTITGAGWFSASLKPAHENIPYDNTYDWTEIFHGYAAYLDRRISYSVVSGDSMEPTFGDNDVVLWVEVDPAELKENDIIIYNHPTKPGEGPIVHRIIDIIKNGEYQFETKGDNRSESDAETPISAYYVSEDDLIGLVIGVLYSTPPE
jgi:signal peptidase I